MRRVQLAFCALLVVVGCKTATLIPRAPIEVPPNLTLPQVEIALLAAITEKPVSIFLEESLEAETRSARSVRLAALGNRDRPRVGWFPEALRPGRIVTTYRHGKRQLRVAIRYSRFEVTMELLGSENMRQTRNRIHGRALVWMSELESRIEQSLEAVAFLTS